MVRVARAGVVAFLALAGCLEPSSITCADGTVCAADLVCAPVHGCASPERVAACAGVADGDACEVETVPGVCNQGVCAALVCGDGLVTGNEQCDAMLDATTTCRDRGFYQGGTVGCAGDCSWDTASCSEFCGDHVLQSGEELCEIGVGPDGTCVSFGFDAGRLGCAGCGVDFAACRIIGWSDATIDVGVGLAVFDLADAGDAVIAVGVSVDDGSPFAARWRDGWSLMGTLEPDLQPASVWAIDSEQVWMTGARISNGEGFAAFWDGARWTVDELPTRGIAIWTSGRGAVFVLSEGGVRIWDGNQWSFTALGDAFVGTALVGDAGSGVVYAAGYSQGLFRFDGEWAPMAFPPGGDVIDLVVDQEGGLIAATLMGGIFRREGDSWVDLELPVVPEDVLLRIDDQGRLLALARWSSATSIGRFSVFHLQAGSWRILSDSIDPPLTDLFSRAFGGSGQQLFLFADFTGFQYGGAAWWDLSPRNLENALDVWASSDRIVLIAASGGVREYNGKAWRSTGKVGDKVDGAGDDVYVLDIESSQIHHRDAGGVWSTSVLGVSNPTDIAVRGRDDVFVLAQYGTEVDHWNGSTATPVEISAGILYSIACAADGPCAAVGEPGTFWSSEPMPQPSERMLFAVWAAPDGTIVVGGDYGGIWLYDGEWHPMDNAGTKAINFIGGPSADDLFAAGGGAELLHYDGGEDLAWLPVRRDAPDGVITALAGVGDGLLVAGDNPALVRLERTYPW